MPLSFLTLLFAAILYSSPAFPVPVSASAVNAAPSISQEAATRVAGIGWTKPERWKASLPKPMRVATYSITDPKGSADMAECAVFFFGEGQGGSVDDNIQRWATQFEGKVTPKQASKTVNGLKVTTVQIAGTYLAPGGPMMQSQGSKKNYRLLGAIIEAPEGPVFFKLTGPSKVVGAIEKEFHALVESVKK